jgi:RNA polymerase sigma-70 factor (ECF subfamily)
MEIVDISADPQQSHADREAVEQLYDAVRALAPADRALVLLYLDGISYSEMSEVIGITETNVGVRLNRIKKTLAERMRTTNDVA